MSNDTLPQSILAASDGEQVPLTRVSVSGCLRDLAAEIVVEQHYANSRPVNIEAVYTFPLPVGAVLLGLELELGDRKLQGQVVEKKQAEHTYESAVSSGDTAVMLEESGPGIYTMNLGNLQSGEIAIIRYRYGLMLSWQGSRVRLLLPTTLAPRYGDPKHAGLLEHQIPQSNLLVEYPFDLTLMVEGILSGGSISSPSHTLGTRRTKKGVELRLSGEAFLDRDFVLVMEAEAQSIARFVPLPSGQSMSMASLRIPPIAAAESVPLNLKVVIDCSGSMAGVGIAQARKAALEILNQLKPSDHFNITLFGDTVQHFWDGLVPAEPRYLIGSGTRLANMDANLGGTETGKALDQVYRMHKNRSTLERIKNSINAGKRRLDPDKAPPSAQVLLITDGQVWDAEAIVEEARTSGHRVFTVGVGMATVEGLFAALAKATGGAMELVSPQEGMTECILTQFHRLRQPKLANCLLKFSNKTTWITPLPKTVFAGDTVHVYAGFSGAPCASVMLTAQLPDGKNLKTEARIEQSDWDDLPRLAAAARIGISSSEKEQKRLAIDHQLLTAQTNYIVVAKRKDKGDDLPELAKVPHMLAAGWGGLTRCGSKIQHQKCMSWRRLAAVVLTAYLL
jgi:Ca-activated chloride channel family protein